MYEINISMIIKGDVVTPNETIKNFMMMVITINYYVLTIIYHEILFDFTYRYR